MGRSDNKKDMQENPSQQMPNGQPQNGSCMLINNDQNFFSPIVTPNGQQQTPYSIKNGRKYQADVEMTSMQLRPPNDKIWTTGKKDEVYERKLRRKYYKKLIVLAILLVLFLSLIVASAILYTYVENQEQYSASTLSLHTGTTTRYKMSSQKPSATQHDKIPEISFTDVPDLSTKPPSKGETIPSKTNEGALRTSALMTIPQSQDEVLITDITAFTTESVTETDTPPVDDMTMSTSMALDKDLITEIVTEVDSVTMPSTTDMTESEVVIQTTQSVTFENTRHMTTLAEKGEATSSANTDVITVTDIVSELLTEDETSTFSNAPSNLGGTSERQTGSNKMGSTQSTLFPRGTTEITSVIPSISTHVATFGQTSHMSTHQVTSLQTPTTILSPLPPGCLEIPVAACRNALSQQRGTTASDLQDIYNVLSETTDMSTCHVDANKVVCSLHAIPCIQTSSETIPYIPCRSTCLQVATSCFKESDPGTFQFFQDELCSKLPESSEEAICFPTTQRLDNDTVNSCNASYCLNNGSCFDMDGQPFCRCPPGQYAGRRCQVPFLRPADPVEQDIPLIDESESCQPITEQQCAQVLPYNQTLELLVSGSPQRPPWEIVAPVAACSDKAKLLFCAEIHAEWGCGPGDRPPYIVCKSLCREVKAQCEFFFTALGFPLDCDPYPDASSHFNCV